MDHQDMTYAGMHDASEYAFLLAYALNDAIEERNGDVMVAKFNEARQHFEQIALSMGYTIAPRKPLPSIATTAGDV